MLKYSFLVICCVLAFQLEAQTTDFPSRGSEVNNNPRLNSSSSNSGSNFLGVPNRSKVKDRFSKEEDGVDFKPKTKFTNPSDLYTDKLNKKYEDEDRKMKDEWAEDMSLGEFTTNSDKMVFLCRDHMMFDGDRVQIRVNGDVIVENLLLENAYKEITIPLEVGFNKIEFIALNQGDAGPNTAELRVIDGNKLVTRNVWNLLTGVKASTMIVRNE